MRVVVGLAVLVVAGASLTACGGDGDAAGDDMTLRVNVFGNFGYEDLYKQFEKDHPGVKIVETAEGDLGAYNTQLTQKIAAGSGAGDVVAIEEGQVVNFLQSPDKFVNFQDHGSNDQKDQWLDWKYAQATTADGTDTIGLGTDVGGLAMCYRRDLFEKAGLPTDRDEVSALWPTWDDYIATGEKFQDGHRRRQGPLRRRGHQHLQLDPHAERATYTYFDTDDNLVIDTNPAVKDGLGPLGRAWSTPGMSAKLQSFSNEWNAGFKNGTFATIACPAWMTGYIKEQAGDGQRRQVGHRHRCPAAAATGAARSWRCPTASKHQDWPSSWPSS